MNAPPATPASTLRRAREIALAEGLHYVYTGNVHDSEGGTTYCPRCRSPLIVRDWYRIDAYLVTPEGKCPGCHAAVAGRYEVFKPAFAPKRTPVAIPQPVKREVKPPRPVLSEPVL